MQHTTPHRSGITLVEVTVAAVVMSTLLVLLGQATGWVAVARRQADRRQVALAAASNVLERITALDFDEIDGERANQIARSDSARDLLDDDALLVEVHTEDDGLAGKRIAVAVRYGERAQPRMTVRLTAWVFERGAK